MMKRVYYPSNTTARVHYPDGTKETISVSHPAHLQEAIRLADRQHSFTIDPIGTIEEVITTEIFGEDY